MDWQNDFDRVDGNKLLDMLRNIGVIWRERRLIRNLYVGQRVKLRLNGGEIDSEEIRSESDRDVAYQPYYLTYMKNI